MKNWMCMCINVRVVVFFFFFSLSLAPDQCSPAWLQLSCNYTAVCDVRLLKRSNTVSILSWGIDLRGLIRCHERSLAVFWCHTIVFFLFYFMPVFLSSSVLFYFHVWGTSQWNVIGTQRWLLSRGQQEEQAEEVRQACEQANKKDRRERKAWRAKSKNNMIHIEQFIAKR